MSGLAATTGSAAARSHSPGPYWKETHVKTSQLLIASAVAAALALPIASQAGPAPKPKFEAEKCYGITKAGKNDCQTANSSCAGTSKRDSQGDAWIYMPAGACDKVVGGSKDPKKA
jgi:uncharacterized membrane protein